MIPGIRSVYIAGKMRGLPHYGFLAFDAAAERIRELGYTVKSPAEIDRSNGFDPVLRPWIPWDENMLLECIKRDTEAICDTDGLVLLPGWETSLGATTEVAIAKWAQRQVFELGDFINQHFVMEEQAAYA